MPTYEYECDKCKYAFDVFQKMTDEPIASCPKCAGPATRLISKGGGVIFKGSGEPPSACPKAGECKNCPENKKNK